MHPALMWRRGPFSLGVRLGIAPNQTSGKRPEHFLLQEFCTEMLGSWFPLPGLWYELKVKNTYPHVPRNQAGTASGVKWCGRLGQL